MGAAMEVGDVTQIRRNGNRSTENIVGSTNEIWPPPLVLTETFGSADNSLRQEAFEPKGGYWYGNSFSWRFGARNSLRALPEHELKLKVALSHLNNGEISV